MKSGLKNTSSHMDRENFKNNIANSEQNDKSKNFLVNVNCEPSVKDFNKRGNKSFWQAIFGDKKCRCCLRRKIDCVCTENIEKDNRNIQTQSHLTCMLVDKIEPGTQKVKTNRKCSSPLSKKKGWGCNVYFNIDKKQNKSQIRNKRIICDKKEELDNKVLTRTSTEYLKNECLCGERNKMATVREEPLNNTRPLQSLKENNYAYTNLAKVKTLVNEIESIAKNNTEQLTKNKLKNDTILENNQTSKENKSSENGSGSDVKNINKSTNIKIEKESLPCSKITIENKKEPVLEIKKETKKSDRLDELKGIETIMKDNSEKESSAKRERYTVPIKRDNNTNNDVETQQSVPPNNNKIKFEEADQSQYIPQKKTSEKSVQQNVTGDIPPYAQKNTIKGSDEDQNRKASGEDDVMTSYVKRSSRKSSGGQELVRNSLISLRQQRRQSVIDNAINTILQKLVIIEEKLEVLENYNKNKDKTVVMGISCCNKQSTISIKCNEQKKDKKNQESDSKLSRKSIKTWNIQSRDENICITATKDITPNVRINGLKSTEISATQNNYEKEFIQKDHPVFMTNNKHKEGPFMCDKWRRISEELKTVPNPRLNKCCAATE